MVWLSGRGPPVRLSQTVSGGPGARPHQGRRLIVPLGRMAENRPGRVPPPYASRWGVRPNRDYRRTMVPGREGGGWEFEGKGT